MITSEVLRQWAAVHPGRFLVDAEGRSIGPEGIPDDAPVPGLLVGPVTEAVKLIDAGAIVHYLGRDTLWVVEGFLLDRDVIDALPNGIDSGPGLLRAVPEAGYEWRVVSRT